MAKRKGQVFEIKMLILLQMLAKVRHHFENCVFISSTQDNEFWWFVLICGLISILDGSSYLRCILDNDMSIRATVAKVVDRCSTRIVCWPLLQFQWYLSTSDDCVSLVSLYRDSKPNNSPPVLVHAGQCSDWLCRS